MEIDTSRFDEKIRRTHGARAAARTDYMRIQTGALVGFVLDHGPRKTNRYVRAVAQAGNETGAGPWPLPPVVANDDAESIEYDLREQLRVVKASLEYWTWLKDKYENTPTKTKPNRKHQPYYKTVRRNFFKWQRRHQSAVKSLNRFLESNGTAVVFNRFASGEQVDIGHGRTAFIRRRLLRAVSEVHGGSGRVEVLRSDTFVHLVNREPHARFVNRNTRIMSRAMYFARGGTGVKRLSKRRYLRRFEKAGGISPARAGGK